MSMLIRAPHGFIRRHLSALERILVAAGLALALYQLMISLPVYPSPWEIVIAVTIFLVMLWSPALAYFLAITAALYPLYSLSMYLAVLFLAVALLGQRVFIHNLGATLLVLLTPWLAQFHMEWLVVLLGGLWWGKAAGAWMGGLACLWGQLLFGMAGQSPNWLDEMGFLPAVSGMLANFQNAGSLDTLKLIVAPIAPNPTQLLYHLLQIVLWAMTAAMLGRLAETTWTQQKHPWRAIGLAIISAAALALLNVGLTRWLEEYQSKDLSWIFPGMMESALYSSVAVIVLETLRDLIEHPLPIFGRPRSRPASSGSVTAEREPLSGQLISHRLFNRLSFLRRSARSNPSAANLDTLTNEPASAITTASATTAPVAAASATAASAGQPANDSYPPASVSQNQPRRDNKKKPPDDIIKIELD